MGQVCHGQHQTFDKPELLQLGKQFEVRSIGLRKESHLHSLTINKY